MVTRWEESGTSRTRRCVRWGCYRRSAQSVGAAGHRAEPPPGKGSRHGECVVTCGAFAVLYVGIPACNTQVFGRQPRQHDRTPRDTAHSGRTAGGVQGACRTLSLSRTDLVKRARSTTIRVEYEAAGCAERFFPLHLLLFCPLLTPHALIVLDLFGLAVCEYPSRDPRRRPRCWHAGSSIAHNKQEKEIGLRSSLFTRSARPGL